jgi:DNA-directed RNA polymerase subunit beta
MENSELVKFGKDEERVRPPKMQTGLLGLGEDLDSLDDLM